MPPKFESKELLQNNAEVILEVIPENEGWSNSSSLMRELGGDHRTIQKRLDEIVAEKVKENNTTEKEYKKYGKIKNASCKPAFHYTKEIIDTYKQKVALENSSLDIIPEDEEWDTASSLKNELRSNIITIEKRLDKIVAEKVKENNTTEKEYKRYGRGKNNQPSNHYSKEILEIYKQEVAQKNEQLDIVPESEGWGTISFLVRELGGGAGTVQKRIDEIVAKKVKENNTIEKEYKRYGRGKKGNRSYYYSKEIFEIYRQEVAQKNEQLDIIPESEGWGTSSSLMRELGGDYQKIQKRLDEIVAEKVKENNTTEKEYKRYGSSKKSQGSNIFHYAKEILEIYEQEVAVKNKQLDIIPENEGWDTVYFLIGELGSSARTTQKRLDEIVAEKVKENNTTEKEYKRYGRGKSGQPSDHYSKEIIEIYRQEVAVKNKQLDIIPENEGWITASSLEKKVGIGSSSRTIQKRLDEIVAEKVKENNVEIKEYRRYGKGKGGPPAYHYSKEIFEFYRQSVALKKSNEEFFFQELQEENKIKVTCEYFLNNVVEGGTVESSDFKKLMSIFGTARVVDLLYAFHPDFKKLPVDYLKSELAKYLGDYMIVRSGNVLGDVELALPYLGEKSFQESLFTVIKEDAIHYYQVNKKKHKEKEDNRILDEYITLLKDKAILFHSDDFDDVVSQVESYIFSILNDFDKPKNIIDELNHGRTFPDLNQTINIKEVRDGRRVLIGDEMGMGKSASAILSKEYLGVGTALVVVPSNVISTWRRYVSDDVGLDGKQLGYFKKGSAPRVLEIGSIEDIAKIQSGEFDYIIISHEKFNSEYAEKLKDSPIEMVIIDEVHKFKNVNDGVRSQALLDLMQEFKERDAYTVLLSGTPVPNKIQDLAVTLKLLYPEEFGQMDNAVLVSSIIKGDNINLRDLLFKKTQMKKLAESVDMPEKVERDSFIELSEQERELYELLLDDDELTATEKLMTLRQFCLNPRKVFPDIEIQSSKVREAKHAIESHFETNNKLVFFVNGYIDGIIRGENTILEQMQLPSDITIKIIDGAVSKEERAEIERDLKYMTHGKVLLVLSGQAADVGVDFSSAESVYFYNEPWTKFDKMQQQARVYRPGLTHDITVDTSLVEGSVEEGIHYYLEMKYKAVMKLLEGVPLSEIEQKMLLLNEKISDNNTIEGDQGLAEEWLQSPVNRLNRFFGATKEIGEEKMKGFLEKYGEEYAEYYAEMGSRGFQANTSRLVTALIKKYQEEKGVESPMTILDVASGPEMLRKRMNKDDVENLYSLDINKSHFTEQNWRQVVAGFTDTQFADNSVDYLNMSLAVHYSSFRPSRDEFERLEVFGEIARVLKVGGRSTINLVHSLEWKNRDELGQLLKELGLSVVDEGTGLATSGNRFMSECLTFEKVQEINIKEKIEVLKNEDSDLLDGLKLATKGKTKLRKSQEIIKDFSLNGSDIEVALNEEDTHLLHEQESAYDEWKVLFEEYNKKIEEIPREVLLKKSILRYISGSKYKFVKKGEYSGSFIRLN